jgi:3-oxoacyl-(acyl-carrier-protein) synthase
MRAAIAGVAVWGPGLPDWPAGRPAVPVPDFLSPTERRRAGVAVRVALAVAQQAAAMAGLAPADLRSLFATANGDGALVHGILETLATPGRPAGHPLSPTQFHNSVHNAAAGYWTIGHGATRPASCLGCHDASFATALLKAVAEVAVEAEPVLLCVYDVGRRRR